MRRPSQGRPRILYISYDGASEPLGRSQVVAYLVRLAPSCEITLISFEKPDDDRTETARILQRAGVNWVPIDYHRRPPVLSTAWDIIRGAVRARREAQRINAQIVHARSYVAGTMAALARRGRAADFLFDIRGFWVDERVDGMLWPSGGWLYRLGKRCERWLFRQADAVVTLTSASVPQIKDWVREPAVPISVIPTCVALERFQEHRHSRAPRLVWSGSVGTVYRFDLAPRLAVAADRPLLVLTRQGEQAQSLLGDYNAEIRSVPHERISDELGEDDIGLCLYSSGFSHTARAPTRFGEYLAAGMLVAVTPGVGDLDRLVSEHHVGAVVSSDDDESLRGAVVQLRELAADPNAPQRCRALAAKLFSLDDGVSDYLALYDRLLAEHGSAATPVVSSDLSSVSAP